MGRKSVFQRTVQRHVREVRARHQMRLPRNLTGRDVVGITFAIATMPLFGFIFFQIFWWLHVLVYPQDSGGLETFLGGSLTLPQFLTLVFPVFGTIALGMMAGNGLVWVIAKRKGHAFEQSYKIAKILVPLTLTMGMIGALLPPG